MAKRGSAVHVDVTKRTHKGRVYQTQLLRRSYRENGKVKKETVANLSHLPPEVIDLIRRSLKGEVFVSATDAFRTKRSAPHGHIAAVLGVMKGLGMDKLLDRNKSRERDIALALICQQVISPGSKLSHTRRFKKTTLGEIFCVEGVTEAEVLGALDWLFKRKDRIESRLAHRHLKKGGLVLYDLSSSYVEGRCCPLAEYGYNRDKKKGKKQINYGLTLAPSGHPVAIETFSGSTKDYQTVLEHIERITLTFGIEEVTITGDRGMIIKGHLNKLKELKVSWITALKASQLAALAEGGALQMSLFDKQDLAEITHPDYPGERLILCRNPLVAAERQRKREDLIQATEIELDRIRGSVERGRVKEATDIALKIGRVANRYKMEKHFEFDISEGHFNYRLKEEAVEKEAALDGFYCIRASVSEERLSAPEVVRTYKKLSLVEQAFRTIKMPDIEIRPIFHHLENRVRAHVFLCMLAYYVHFELRGRLKELLFDDETPEESPDPVAKAKRSASAIKKTTTKTTATGHTVHSFGDLLDELANITRNTVQIAGTGSTFTQLTEINPLQERVFELLGFAPNIV